VLDLCMKHASSHSSVQLICSLKARLKARKYAHNERGSRLDRECLSGTQQDIVNRKTALLATDTGKLNSVYFGLQTAKKRTGVLTHPTGGHQAGQCHASIDRPKLLLLTITESHLLRVQNVNATR